jgi:hypothetical protein
MTRELRLIQKELESLGEALEDERLGNRSEIDRLKVQLEAIKQALDACVPGFKAAFDRSQDDLKQHYDPEAS